MPYRYRDHNRQLVDGEIWCPGPLPHSLWVHGPAGAVVVDTDTHTTVHYTPPVYLPDEHVWHYPDRGTSRAPIDFRGKKAAVGTGKWRALTVEQREPIARPLPANWGLTLELPGVARRAVA